MTQQTAVDLIRLALQTAFWVALPMLAVGFVVGIVVSLLQVLTSLQDPGLAAVPRLAAFLVALLVLLPWMVTRMVSYTMQLWGDLARYAG